MNIQQKPNVITLSDRRSFEKSEIVIEKNQGRTIMEKNKDFVETLFCFLGDKRFTLISYISMKLDRRKRLFFSEELEKCQDVRAECQCVKKYFRHLKTNDAMSLLASLPEMLSGKIEALTFHGEKRPEKRLEKFVKLLGLSDADIELCMLLFLFTRDEHEHESVISRSNG